MRLVNFDAALPEHVRIRIVAEVNAITELRGGGTQCHDAQTIEDLVICAVQFDRRALICVGGQILDRISIAVPGHGVGGRCPLDRIHDQLFDIGTAARHDVEHDRSVDAASQGIVSIGEAVEIRTTGRLSLIDGIGSSGEERIHRHLQRS